MVWEVHFLNYWNIFISLNEILKTKLNSNMNISYLLLFCYVPWFWDTLIFTESLVYQTWPAKAKVETGYSSPSLDNKVFPLVYSVLSLLDHPIQKPKNTWFWDYLEGILIWLHRTSCAVWGTRLLWLHWKEQMLTMRAIEHHLSYYPGLLLPLSKTGTNNASLIMIDLATNSTLEMNIVGAVIELMEASEPDLRGALKQWVSFKWPSPCFYISSQNPKPAFILNLLPSLCSFKSLYSSNN